MAKVLTSNLHNLVLTDLAADVEAFVAEEPDYAALYAMLRLATGKLQQQAAQLTAEQRQQLLRAALRCCDAVSAVPDDAVVRFCDMVYCLTYSCALKEELELVLSFAAHLDRLLPMDPTRAPSAPVFLNFFSLLIKTAYQARTAPLAAGLLRASLRQLLLSRPPAAKLTHTVYQVSEWGKSRPPAATAAGLPCGVLTLAAAAPVEQRPLLAFIAARLACCGALPTAAFTAQLRQLTPQTPPLRLVTAVFSAAARQPVEEAEAPVELDGEELAGEALYTVHLLMQQLAATTGTSRPPVTVELARLACDSARQMTVSPLPAGVPVVAAGRACNFAHTLLVEAVKPVPAPPALVTAALGMLRAMTDLSGRLAAADLPWWSTVLVTVSGNLGVVNLRSSRHEEGVEAFTTFLTCCAAADRKEVKSANVASKTQLLVDAQRGRHQFGGALRSLARAVPLAADHLPQLFTAWAKVKRDALKRQQTDCLRVTLPRLIAEVSGGEQSAGAGDGQQSAGDGDGQQSVGAGDGAISTIRLLQLEVKHYLIVSRDLTESVRAALAELGEQQLSDADRAWLLVIRARVGLCGAEQAAAESAEAVTLLTNTIGQAKKSPLRLNLCMANYYLCINRKQVEMQASKLSPLTQLKQRPAAPDDEVDLDASCTVMPDYLSINLDREAATLEPLQMVLSVADTLLHTKLADSDSDYHPVSDLLTAVTGAAQLYSGLGYQLQAARAWRLVYRAGRQLSDSEAVLTAACELLQLNLWPEEEDLAPVEAAVEAAADRLVSLRWTLAKAWGHYHLQQVSSALPLLDSVLEDPILLTRTIPHFRVAAEAHRLASLCACVPPSRGRNVLELAGLAAFYAACVKTWLTADKPVCLAEHLYALGLVFDSIRHVGAVLVWMHCPREVRHYVRDQMESAHRVAAALRTAEFLSQLVEADLLCEDAEDTQIKLDSLRHIVLAVPAGRRQKPSVRPAADTPPAAPSLSNPPGRRRRRSPATRPSPAAPEPPAPPESGRDLVAPPGSLGSPLGRDARWLQRQPRCTSPLLRRARFTAPAPLSHPAGCGCASCASPRRLLLLLSLSLQTARAAVLQDDVDQALEFCAGADECYPLLEEKMRRAALSCLGQLRPRQLDALLEPGRVLRCRGRLAHADVCLWFGRPRQALLNSRAALSLLRQVSSRTQLVSRHMYLLTEIWNQKILIENVLNDEDDEVVEISEGLDRLTTDSPLEDVSAGRHTPTPAAPPSPAAEPPRRPAKRAGRTRPVAAPAPATPPSPPLVRSTRRRAAAVRSEITECPPPPPTDPAPAPTPAKPPAPRATRARRRPL